MKYLNAKAILPQAVLEQLQQYAEGQVLYVPMRPQNRKLWGEVKGTKPANKSQDFLAGF
ncbi:MAG: hypothetical protein HFE94_08500 [Acutalibacter sp.]|nr:hypothetical protein [Acutalibacter sp.]